MQRPRAENGTKTSGPDQQVLTENHKTQHLQEKRYPVKHAPQEKKENNLSGALL